MAEPGSDPLAPYRAKRDFGVTSEPTGAGPPPPPGQRFVVQRHRARRLHYDLRLELDGVLVSWAVPRGPTLDAGVKRMAIHVEDHPLDYFDFEGVIPASEYGGGDVIVWDWGTWQPASDDPRADIEAGELHFDLRGEKLAGRFILLRRGRDGGRDWLLLHKRDDDARPGWDPEAHPRSVKSGRSSDEVRDAPSASWSSSVSWAAATSGELALLDDLGRSGTWHLGGHELNLTNLDKVLFPAARGFAALTKRDLIRYHAMTAPAMLPYLTDRPINLRRYPNGVDRPGSWRRAAPSHAPDWIRRWRNADSGPGESQVSLVLDSPAALAWVANDCAVELHPWTSTVRDSRRPTWALVHLEPGAETSFDDMLVVARLHRTALAHLGVEARPNVTGGRGIQIWIPVSDRYAFDDTRAWVESLCRAIGAIVPELVSGERDGAERPGRIRLDSTQNAVKRTLVAPFSVRAAPGGPVSVPITWEELDDPDLSPDRWTMTDVADRIRRRGDPLVPLIGRQQHLPAL